MIFTDLANGAAVSLDADTFVYHFTGHALHGLACRQLLQRISRQEKRGLPVHFETSMH